MIDNYLNLQIYNPKQFGTLCKPNIKWNYRFENVCFIIFWV